MAAFSRITLFQIFREKRREFVKGNVFQTVVKIHMPGYAIALGEGQEAIVCIEIAIRSERPDPERFLAEACELRERIAASGARPQNQKFVRQAIDEGRE